MKQFIRGILLSAVVASALLTGALADDTGAETGIGSVTPVGSTVINEISQDKLSVTYGNAQSGAEYLLIVQRGEGTDLPSQKDIYYIDQKTAEGTSVKFNVYPKTMVNGKYTIRVSSSAEPAQGLLPVGTFTYNAPAPTVNVVNLTGDASLNPVLEGNVLTVSYDKACVVLCSANEENTEENSVKASVAEDWERLEAAKTEGEDNSYTFDLSGKTGTVVIAVKGDVTFDSIIDADDISGLVTVGATAAHQYERELLQLIADVAREGTSNGVIDADDISSLVTAGATAQHSFSDWK